MQKGMHAREWASPPSILYILQNILLFRKYAETFHIYVLPVANPDGYEYTRRKVGEEKKSHGLGRI